MIISKKKTFSLVNKFKTVMRPALIFKCSLLKARLEQRKAALGYKRSTERVMVLACSNAMGEHKLKTALTGKNKKP